MILSHKKFEYILYIVSNLLSKIYSIFRLLQVFEQPVDKQTGCIYNLVKILTAHIDILKNRL